MKVFLPALFVFVFSTSVFAKGTVNFTKDTFSFPQPTSQETENPISLWATSYHVAEFENGSGDIAIRNAKGIELGPMLSLEHWCKGALEGTVRVVEADGSAKTYNYETENDLFPNDCTQFFPFPVGKTKFRIARGPYGDGTMGMKLVPFRSIATDPKYIRPGTVIYVPAARGAVITLADGEVITHDGYFFAADAGGAIKRNHIDVFIGTEKKTPFFKWITSNQSLTFTAFIITDFRLKKELKARHQ